jgi:hypothetical protein
MVQAQLTEIFDRMLESEDGIWSFSRVSEAALAESQVHLPTQGLLMDSLRKLDEMRHYREVVRSVNSIVRRVDPPGTAPGTLRPPIDLADPRFQRLAQEARESSIAMYQQLPAVTSVQDLMKLSGKAEYDVTRLVFHLSRAQLVQVSSAESVSLAPRAMTGISKGRARDVVVVYSMAIREVFNELSQIQQSGSLLEAATGFLRSSPPEHAAILGHVEILPDGGIDETPLLVGIQSTQASADALNKALSELLFFLLFEASEHLPPRRRDDLARRVKMIHAMLPTGEEVAERPQ